MLYSHFMDRIWVEEVLPAIVGFIITIWIIFIIAEVIPTINVVIVHVEVDMLPVSFQQNPFGRDHGLLPMRYSFENTAK